MLIRLIELASANSMLVALSTLQYWDENDFLRRPKPLYVLAVEI